ncbi:hypothetical protein [Amycolatopsis sp. NBC_01286]|uniref:hypothetical protein n=1 Tax=Amycolatopsis sp. NBC_01286 TaxID=2903560 RepID=UPI003FA3DBFB
MALLEDKVGTERIEADLHLANEVVRHCGYHPLAVALVAGLLVSHSTWSLSYLIRELEKAVARLPRE